MFNDTYTDEPDWSDRDLPELERDDDVTGSGIFDPLGRLTVHRTMGVFADHPSMPGFVARNPPFSVSKDVADITDGADVVEVPAGGYAFVDRGVRPIPAATTNVQPYAFGAPPAPIGWQNTANVAMGQRPVRAFGAEPTAPGWGTWLFGGLLIGVGAAIFYGAVSGKAAAR